MFVENSKVVKAAKIINSIEDGKFMLLLNRIAQYLSNDSNAKPFTAVEEEKLGISLEITKLEVQILVDGIIEIFYISSYYIIKPALLTEQLSKELSLSFKKTEIFVQVWTASAKGIVDNLRQKIYFPQVNHISYSLSVMSGSDLSSKEKLTKAQLQLGLASTSKQEDINIEFSHEELYELYRKLEVIQGQLDALR